MGVVTRMNNMTECIVCTKGIELLEEFNGEMMCQDCYNDSENEVFTDE